MAFFDKFNKPWSSENPVQEVPDFQRAEGWDFLGNQPPLTGQFDAVQQETDQKIDYLFNLVNSFVLSRGGSLTATDTNELRDIINEALQAAQGGHVGYVDKLTMDADTTRPIGTIGEVLGDPIESNNGWYLWDGTQWTAQLSPFDYINKSIQQSTSGRVWLSGSVNTKVKYEESTRTLSWDGTIISPLHQGLNKRIWLLAQSVVIPNSNYQIVWIDLDEVPNTQSDTPASAVHVGGYGDSADDFKGLPNQLPIFVRERPLVFRSLGGFFKVGDSREAFYSTGRVWMKGLPGDVISYNDETRTLAWNGVLVSPGSFGSNRIQVAAGSVIIPDISFATVWIDLRKVPLSSGLSIPADAIVAGAYGSGDESSRYTGAVHQLPIFYRERPGVFGPAMGFFETQIDGVYYPYDTTRIAQLENTVNELASDGSGDVLKLTYHFAPLTSFNDTSNSAYVVDLDGRVIGGPEMIKALKALIEESGSGGGSVPRDPVYIKDGMLKIVTASGEETYVDITPYAFEGSAQWNGKHILTSINRATLGAITPVAVGGDDGWIGSKIILPSGLKLMLVIISFGQSNSVGAQAYAPPAVLTHNLHPETLLMCDGPGNPDIRFGLPSGSESVGSEVVLDPSTLTGFKPLVSMQSQLVINQGATVLEGMGYSFADAVYKTMGVNPRIVMGAAGWGGRFQSDLAKGTIPYQNFMTALTKIKQLAEAEGYLVMVPFIPIIHGESDSTRAAYMEGIKTWQSDFNADIKAITGQQNDVPFLCSQASTFSGTAAVYGVLAPYEASELATTHHLGPAYYPYSIYTDNLHMGQSGAILGEKMGHVAARVLGLFGTETYGTIRPLGIAFDGANTIDITFIVPTKPLVRDTVNPIVNSPPPADWGFRIKDGSGASVAISSINIIGDDTVRIVTETSPSAGVNRVVEYALNGFPASPKVTGLQPRGQLRDSTNIQSFIDPSITLYDWCPHLRENF